RCEKEVDQAVAALIKGEVSFSLLVRISRTQAEHLWQFRFLLDHLVAVCQAYPYVKRGMQAMYRRREEELKVLLQFLRQKGYLRSELNEAHEANLIKQYLMVVDFAQGFISIFSENASPPQQFEEYAQMWLSLLAPWLSPAGKVAWEAAQSPVK
ncbi:MAG: TetR/AcrR family transcriptional regulator, partial [Bacteroidota bacterium]